MNAKFPPLALLAALCQVANAAPAPPADLTITNVSTKSFHVVWHSSPETEPEIDVFSNPAGTMPLNGLAITPYPMAGGDTLVAAESSARGLLSIGVAGLQPATTYYIRARSREFGGGAASVSPLIPVQTAAVAGLVGPTTPFTAFANPLVGFQGISREGGQIDLSAIVTAAVPGARSPVAAVVGGDELVWLDLNNLVAHSNGRNLRVQGSEPLTLRVFRGAGKPVDTFEFFAPENSALAEAADPQLTPGPLTGGVAVARSNAAGGAVRVFLEFPVEAGAIYEIQRSPVFGAASWTRAAGPLRADRDRLFWEDNGLAGTDPPPSAAPRMFYRLRKIDP